MANQQWDTYKSEIERLYIHENRKLKDVMSYMKTQHSWEKRQVRFTRLINFAADQKYSKASYTNQLKKWGFRKNSKSRKDEWISRKGDKRKRGGKESEFFEHGLQLHPNKVAKAKYGKGFVSTIAQFGKLNPLILSELESDQFTSPFTQDPRGISCNNSANNRDVPLVGQLFALAAVQELH